MTKQSGLDQQKLSRSILDSLPDEVRHAFTERDDQIAELSLNLEQRDEFITILKQSLAERHEHIEDLANQLDQVRSLAQDLNARNEHDVRQLTDKGRKLDATQKRLEAAQKQFEATKKQLAAIKQSRAWRVTAPLRRASQLIQSLRRLRK